MPHQPRATAGIRPKIDAVFGRACGVATHRPRISRRPRCGGLPSRTGATAGGDASTELREVEDLRGMRVVPGDKSGDDWGLEYLVEWKGDGEEEGICLTWEPAVNLSQDLVRDFDEKWWNAVKDCDPEVLGKMLQKDGRTLTLVVDENGRCALHFAAALGKPEVCQLLLACGADPNCADKDGYTPLHMASGYLHISCVQVLLEAGADPEYPDESGRTPLTLMESLRDNLPIDNPNNLSRRMALEQVIGRLQSEQYELLYPVAVLDVREVGEEKEYLVQWPDDFADSWVPGKDLSAEVREDFENEMEYAEAECVMDIRRQGDERKYLVKWKDGQPDTWEPEQNIASKLIRDWEERKQQEKEKSITVEKVPKEVEPVKV